MKNIVEKAYYWQNRKSPKLVLDSTYFRNRRSTYIVYGQIISQDVPVISITLVGDLRDHFTCCAVIMHKVIRRAYENLSKKLKYNGQALNSYHRRERDYTWSCSHVRLLCRDMSCCPLWLRLRIIIQDSSYYQ